MVPSRDSGTYRERISTLVVPRKEPVSNRARGGTIVEYASQHLEWKTSSDFKIEVNAREFVTRKR